MTSRRLILRAYDALCLLVMAAALVALWPSPALAYVDPSVMTYTIQALAGVAVALSAVLGVALRRSRRVIMRLLHIDENANKEVEPAVHRVAADSDRAEVLAEADRAAVAAKERLRKGRQPRRLGWARRFGLALAASAFLVGTVFVVAPLEVVAGGASSLIFTVNEVWPYVLGAGCAGAVVLALLASAVRGRAFDVVLAIIVALGVGSYVQALCLNQSLPVADGSPLYLEWYKTIAAISTVVWVAIIAAFVALACKKAAALRPAAVVVSLALILVQGVGVASLFSSHEPAPADSYVLTKEGLYEVGSDGNIIVFVLDTFDTKLMNKLLADDPHLLDEFAGFTYFEDSVGSMIPTRYGVPFLLTGRVPASDDDFGEFFDAWYDDTTLLPDIAAAGYTEGVYTDSLGPSGAFGAVAPIVENIHPASESPARAVDVPGLIGILDKVALYRDAPWLVKPLFWFTTDEVNNQAMVTGKEDGSPYVMNDWSFYEGLLTKGLSMEEGEKAFRFIHLLGAHYPFVLDETGHMAPHETNQDIQTLGSLQMVNEYLRQLKELGLYDEATIILTADHGDWYLTPDVVYEPTSPVLLVKPAESAEEASRPLVISHVPTGHLDYPATVIDAAGGDSEKYGPTVFEVTDDPRLRYYWMTTSDGHKDVSLREYAIDGDVLDFDNWELTGREIQIG
ncbi:MAG: arylsulfatase [Eggerthellaceae bacterium]|nr:arylsulfatase [Eggerthellaceae bacterium]